MNSGAEFWVGPGDAPDTYQLVTMLGGGGEGDVWRAVLPLSDAGRRQVAVKIMRGTGSAEEDVQWARFGHLLQSLAHPGLVRVTGVFTGPGPHRRGEPAAGVFRYVAMDFVDGVTLREWVDENPDARAAARLAMLRTVAAALDEMHSGAATEVPVAHGDVKPANIVVRPDGGTVLVDLGLARLADAAGLSGRSNPYAAPELRGPGAQATPEADAFAFAATAAQVLTGQPLPTDAQGFLDLATLHRLLNSHPVTARRPMLVRQILSALSAPPEARPRQLSAWLAGATDTLSQVTTPSTAGPMAAGPVPAGAPPDAATTVLPGAGRPRGRRKRLLIGAAVLVVLLAGGSAFALAAGGNKHHPQAGAPGSTALSTPAGSSSSPDSLPPTDTPPATDTPPTGIGPPTKGPPSEPTLSNGTPPPTDQWVSDLTVVDYDQASNQGSQFSGTTAYKINGVLYGHSIAVTPGCSNGDGGDYWTEFDLSRSWSKLTAVVGITDDSPDGSRVSWRIYGDGKILKSGVSTLGASTRVQISVKNVLRLRLWINDPRAAQPNCDVPYREHLGWGNVQLTA